MVKSKKASIKVSKNDYEIRELRHKALNGEFFDQKEELFLGLLLKESRKPDATVKEKRAGDCAADLLARSNSRLVYKIARNMYNKFPRGTTLEDCINEGMLGMARAIKDYDYTRGYKFSTYATRWIIHFIQRRAHSIGTPAKFPGSRTAKIIDINHDIDSVKAENGRVTSQDYDEILSKHGVDAAEYNKMLTFNAMSISLDGPAFKNDDNGSMVESLGIKPDNTSTMGQSMLTPEEHWNNKELISSLNRAMDKLDDDEREVLSLLYGPGDMTDNGEKKMTIVKAREIMGMKRSEFQRTLRSAKTKLRKSLEADGYEF